MCNEEIGGGAQQQNERTMHDKQAAGRAEAPEQIPDYGNRHQCSSTAAAPGFHAPDSGGFAGRQPMPGPQQMGAPQQMFAPMGPSMYENQMMGASMGQPMFGQQQMSPPMGQPMFGQQQMSPPMGQPMFGQQQMSPPMGQPMFGQQQMSPPMGQPMHGPQQVNPPMGQPMFGMPMNFPMGQMHPMQSTAPSAGGHEKDSAEQSHCNCQGGAHAGSAGMFEMMEGMIQNNPQLASIHKYVSATGNDFLKGMLLGAGLALLFSSDSVKDIMTGMLGGMFSKEQEEE